VFSMRAWNKSSITQAMDERVRWGSGTVWRVSRHGLPRGQGREPTSAYPRGSASAAAGPELLAARQYKKGSIGSRRSE
jgi:hypothetical protein